LALVLHSLPAGGGLVLASRCLRLDLAGFLLGADLRLFHLGLQFVAALAGGCRELGLGLVDPAG
jgi:hypothetical protein